MKLIHPVRLIQLVAALSILVGCLSSCNPVKKAVDTFNRNPKAAADYCADHYGCPTIRHDSSAFVQSKKVIDSLFDEVEKQRILDSASAANMVEAIDRLRSDSMRGYNLALCDSIKDELYRITANETRRANTAEKQLREVRGATNAIAPAIEYIKDPAREKQLENQVESCTDTNVKLMAENETLKSQVSSWKGKAKTRWWLLLAIISAVVGFLLRKPILSLIKGVFMKTTILFLFLFMTMALTGCVKFHDDPTKSVWSEGLWVVFWLPFLGSLWFLYVSYRASRSNSTHDKGNVVLDNQGNVPIYKVVQFRFFVALQIAAWVIYWAVTSNR
ncbi:MAG: hypothetical protein H7Y42_07730 [Chitinophagaceae bacterium]|nr:hypothetical protein [Chitinophagaceae bacterium]